MRRITILIGALAALMLVPAASAFAEEPNVKVVLGGTGHGEVTSLPIKYFGTEPAIECSNIPGEEKSACEGYPEGEEAEEGYFTPRLKQKAALGSEFVGWTIVKGEPSLYCPNTFDPAHPCWLYNEEEFENDEWEVIAEFDLEEVTPPAGPPLTLDIEEGEGTVVSNPAGINCSGSEGESCTTEEIAEGQVTLTASPAAGYRFKSWKGCDKKNLPVTGNGVNGRQCTITLNGERSVSAKFVKTWNVTIENGGNGKVSTKPGGALCLPNCSEVTASFDEGKNVEVLSKPNKHFHFVEFGGDCSGSSCTLASISADHTVSASFAEDTKYALSLAKEGGGQALVKTKPPGMVCSYTCGQLSASFYEGEVIEVKWKLGKGTSSIDWSSGAGTCTGTSEAVEGVCTVTMSAARELVADLG